jgi:tetratricopeptide (TPR) repeat protein
LQNLEPPPGCALLTTSRRRFSLRGLMTYDLDSLPAADAVTLLRELGPRLSAEEAGALAEACGRLPLALRLAGTTLQLRDDLTPARYLKRLEERGRLRELGEVAAAIAVSEEALSEPLRTRWPELAVFAGGFELPWAAAVWDVDQATAEDELGALRTHSLLSWDAEVGLYRLHDLVREYAQTHLTDVARSEAAGRHACHFCSVMETAGTLYQQGGDSVLAALRLFDRGWLETRAAFSWARQRTADREAQSLCVILPEHVAHLFGLRQPLHEHIDWHSTAVEAARRISERRGEGRALLHLGNVHATLGEPQQALEFLEQALAIAREVGDRQGEGSALGNLGVAHAALGQPKRAIEFYQKRLAIAREIGDRRGEGNALGNLGLAYADLGQPQCAVEYHEQDLALTRQIGDRRGEGYALGYLGSAYAALGQPQRATALYDEALAIAREIGDRWGEAIAIGYLGSASAARGQPQRAIECYEQYLAIAREIGDRRGEATACWNMGLALETLGRIAEAILLLEVSITYLREIGHPDADKRAAAVERLRQQLGE